MNKIGFDITSTSTKRKKIIHKIKFVFGCHGIQEIILFVRARQNPTNLIFLSRPAPCSISTGLGSSNLGSRCEICSRADRRMDLDGRWPVKLKRWIGFVVDDICRSAMLVDIPPRWANSRNENASFFGWNSEPLDNFAMVTNDDSDPWSKSALTTISFLLKWIRSNAVASRTLLFGYGWVALVFVEMFDFKAVPMFDIWACVVSFSISTVDYDVD